MIGTVLPVFLLTTCLATKHPSNNSRNVRGRLRRQCICLQMSPSCTCQQPQQYSYNAACNCNQVSSLAKPCQSTCKKSCMQSCIENNQPAIRSQLCGKLYSQYCLIL
ncbi:hypothetical protein ACH3XW_24200 [Acanthocheilonema viteae]